MTNTNDSGPDSLRQAIADAASGETITFAAGVTGMITLTSGGLVINTDLNIQGPGAKLLTISGNNSVNVFTTFHASLVMSGLTIANGKLGVVSGDPFGAAPMTFSSLVITGNSNGGIQSYRPIQSRCLGSSRSKPVLSPSLNH